MTRVHRAGHWPERLPMGFAAPIVAAQTIVPTRLYPTLGSGDPRCPGCERNATSSDCIQLGGSVWHPACMRCSCCDQPAARFGGQYLLCNRCYDVIESPLCHRCSKPVSAGERQTVSGYIYHRGCVKCCCCPEASPVLRGVDLEYTIYGELFCTMHRQAATELHRCARCDRGVFPDRSLRFLLDGQVVYLHDAPECQRCISCGTNPAVIVGGWRKWHEPKQGEPTYLKKLTTFPFFCQPCIEAGRAGVCIACHLPIGASPAMVQTEVDCVGTLPSRACHQECAKCFHCGRTVKSKRIQISDLEWRGGVLQCKEACCAGCQGPIPDPSRGKFWADGRAWCQSHLNCCAEPPANHCNKRFDKKIPGRTRFWVPGKGLQCDECHKADGEK